MGPGWVAGARAAELRGRLPGIDRCRMARHKTAPLGDYQSALEEALYSPVGAIRLEEHVARGSTVAIVVDDPSRWTPVREACRSSCSGCTPPGFAPRM